MSPWYSGQGLAAASERALSRMVSVPKDAGARRLPMQQSEPIEVDGVFLGVAVKHELGVRFIAVDRRVADMDQSIWPTLQYANSSARQLYKSHRFTAPA